MTKTKTKPGPVMTFPPRLSEVEELLRRAAQNVRDADTAVELAESQNQRADDERARFAASGIDVDDLPTAPEAYESGTGHRGTSEVSYDQHRRVKPETLDALRAELAEAKTIELMLSKQADELRAAGKSWDLYRECARVGTRWFALQRCGVGGQRFQKHEPIPVAVVAGLSESKRAQLQRHRRLGEIAT